MIYHEVLADLLDQDIPTAVAIEYADDMMAEYEADMGDYEAEQANERYFERTRDDYWGPGEEEAERAAWREWDRFMGPGL